MATKFSLLYRAEGGIEFIDANDCQSINQVEHPMACELHWDGTGRYIASAVTSFKQKSDNGVWFWNSVGKLLYQKKMSGLRQFAWRPFPPTLLTPEQIHVCLDLLNYLHSKGYSSWICVCFHSEYQEKPSDRVFAEIRRRRQDVCFEGKPRSHGTPTDPHIRVQHLADRFALAVFRR